MIESFMKNCLTGEQGKGKNRSQHHIESIYTAVTSKCMLNLKSLTLYQRLLNTCFSNLM